MSCSKCNDHGIHLTEGKKLRWVFCSCDIGQVMNGNPSFKSAEAQGKNKFSAEPTERIRDNNVVKFASKKEARRYDDLLVMESAGEIDYLKLHPSYPLKNEHVEIRYPNGRLAVYTADFEYLENDITITEDVKSKATMTEAATLRMAVFSSLYEREVRIPK